MVLGVSALPVVPALSSSLWAAAPVALSALHAPRAPLSWASSVGAGRRGFGPCSYTRPVRQVCVRRSVQTVSV